MKQDKPKDKPKDEPKDKQTKPEDRRKYIRLNAVFPVEFQFLDPETGGSISDIKQGFTRDVGKGGICLEVNNIEEGFEAILREKKAKLDLHLNIPLGHRETKAIADIAWHKKLKAGYPNKYLIGLEFSQIDPKERDRIYFHARRIILTPKIVSVLVLCLVIGLGYFYSMDFKLKKENRKLVEELVYLLDKKAELEKNIITINAEYKEAEAALLENKEEIAKYEENVKQLIVIGLELERKSKLLDSLQQDKSKIKKKFKEVLSEKTRLSKKVESLSKEAVDLKKKIARLSKDRISAEGDLKDIMFSFENVEERSISSMYKWVENHQNRFTGLVISYEGDKDLEDWAFTYDQSLAAQCFTLMGDRDKAESVLDFYQERAEKVDGGFLNAYDAYTGLVLEYAVHTGPNVWIGIAMLQYANKFEDHKYISSAENIGIWLIRMQDNDSEFGLRGGPKFNWFSTEHNLDAYAFFGMLYKVTKKDGYLEAQKRALEWIKKNAFNKEEARFNRGKGDATIATDTFAWAIAAIGPKVLEENDMNPLQIIDFAENNCLVTTYYTRPDGKQVKVTGFDFGKYQHQPRGGIISTEWTAQMVVTLRIMAEFFKEKEDIVRESYYERKADFYLSELQKMVIISPSKIGQGQWCLPYATQDNVDTGHGWRVAKGSRTGSTAGTVYTIFAKYNYNPLVLE